MTGCAPKPVKVDFGAGLPRQVFDQVPVYAEPVNSVGRLTEAYIRNTEGLVTVNSRLQTICIAYGHCKPDQE